MKQFPTLTKAPIVEALGQINFQSNSESKQTFAEIEKWSNSLKADSVEEMFQFQLTIVGDPLKLPFGKKITLEGGRVIVQATTQFLSVSLTGGYEDWLLFHGKVENYMTSFLRELTMQNITRVALRYINQFDFDLSESPANLLTNYMPNAPSGEFATRVLQTQLSYEISKYGAEALVNQSLEPRTNVSKWFSTLDIDVFVNRNLKPEFLIVDSEFGNLRDLKNMIFNSLITEKCRERFK